MEPVLRTIESFDWTTVLLVGSLLLLVIAKNQFYNRFLNFIILPFNNKYIFMFNKKEPLMNWFQVFFSVFQISNLALFLFFIWKLFAPNGDESYTLIFPIILGAILLFEIAKVFLQLGNGFIFGNYKIISEIIFSKLSYLNHSSLLMFMANVILTYVLKDSKIVVYLAVFLILLINAIGWVNVVRIHQKFITNNFFYFILYLCALEIAPFIILGSYLK
ncbi:MAG: DUF4271 domain-containing protein [Maribacter sp.]|nr:DUF4271 domain-containing protein [Maribacter sp.]